MKKHLLTCWLCLLLFLLPSCVERISSESMNKAANDIAKELERFSKGSEKVTVCAIGFECRSGELPDSITKLLEDRLNHYLSRSQRFSVVEVDNKVVKLILEFLREQRKDIYDESEGVSRGKFIPPHYIVTGTIGLDRDTVQINSKLVALETKKVEGSSLASFRLRAGVGTYILWSLIVGVTGIAGYRLWRKFLPTQRPPNADDFQETTCAACGGKIKNRYQVGGKCTTPTCEREICTMCWNGRRTRYCQDCSVKQSRSTNPSYWRA
jgi:hypothetical protein